MATARRSDPGCRRRRSVGRLLPRRARLRGRGALRRPAYATLTLAGTRLSLAEQGHPADDRPGVELLAPADASRADVVLVVEVDDARAEHAAPRGGRACRFLADPYEPPWGGCRFFCVDPDGYLVEIEQPA